MDRSTLIRKNNDRRSRRTTLFVVAFACMAIRISSLGEGYRPRLHLAKAKREREKVEELKVYSSSGVQDLRIDEAATARYRDALQAWASGLNSNTSTPVEMKEAKEIANDISVVTLKEFGQKKRLKKDSTSRADGIVEEHSVLVELPARGSNEGSTILRLAFNRTAENSVMLVSHENQRKTLFTVGLGLVNNTAKSINVTDLEKLSETDWALEWENATEYTRRPHSVVQSIDEELAAVQKLVLPSFHSPLDLVDMIMHLPFPPENSLAADESKKKVLEDTVAQDCFEEHKKHQDRVQAGLSDTEGSVNSFVTGRTGDSADAELEGMFRSQGFNKEWS
mmetsp:Transcript_10903/g.19986  ORF Transcript_10903/g.19986 Transcript_10903/m.19986 type:complete len:337 (-) Transcript_10903:249-1259(-)